jgi:hypothetical protein
MPTISPEHYQLLYQNKFSARGYALLKNEETLTEADKAAFCAETLLKFDFQFNPETATQDDFKDLMLVLKFMIDKNISSGTFLNESIKFDEAQHSQIMNRNSFLEEDDLNNPVFVSSMILLSPGGGREKDFNIMSEYFVRNTGPKIESDINILPKEKLVYDAISFIFILESIRLLRFPDAGSQKMPKREYKEKMEKLKGDFDPLFLNIKNELNRSYDFEWDKLSKPSNIRLFFINACRIVSNFIEPANKNSIFIIIRIPKLISRGFNYLANRLSVENPGLIRRFFIYILKGISVLSDPENPGSLFARVRIFDFISWIFRALGKYLEKGQLKDLFTSEKVFFNQGKGLLDDSVVDANQKNKKNQKSVVFNLDNNRVSFVDEINEGIKKRLEEQNLQEEVKFQGEEIKEQGDRPQSALANKKSAPLILSSPIIAINNAEVKEEKEGKEAQEIKSLKAAQGKASTLWTITHSVDTNEAIQAFSGKSLKDISLPEYQALMVAVVLELDKVGAIKNAGMPIDSGAYSIVDKNNKLFKFFESYYKKAEDSVGVGNKYAYSRDPYKVNLGPLSKEIPQSSHPGENQMGFDIRDDRGALIDIFKNTGREWKTHILVGYLREGGTYLKLEKIGIGTRFDSVRHGLDYVGTRKPMAKLIGVLTSIGGYFGFGGQSRVAAAPRKEHDIKRPIAEAYKRIEADFITKISEIPEKNDTQVIYEIIQDSGKKIISKIEAEIDDEFVLVELSENEKLRKPKFILDMYENLKILGSYLDAKTASDLITQFEEVCAKNGYPREELEYRHGNEIVIDLDTIPALAEDLAKLTAQENAVIDEIMSIRAEVLNIVDKIYPPGAASINKLGINTMLESEDMRGPLEADKLTYAAHPNVVAVHRMLNFLGNPSIGACPKMSEFFDLVCKPVLGKEGNTRQQSAISLMTWVMSQHQSDDLLTELGKVMESLSYAADIYYKAYRMEKVITPGDKDAVEGIESMKRTANAYWQQSKTSFQQLQKILNEENRPSDGSKEILVTIEDKIRVLDNTINPAERRGFSPS